MKAILPSIFMFILAACATAQSDLQQMSDTEKAFLQAVAEKGTRSAFLEFLADDAILFRPTAINGKDFWKREDDSSTAILVRNPTFADISSNGRIGYTTGNWRRYQKGKSESEAEFGQYVTIWEKKPDGKYRAGLDIGITHEKLSFLQTNRVAAYNGERELNEQGWSAADPSMNFLKMSMDHGTLGGAYQKFAAKDVRLLRDGAPPIIGKKNVVKATKQYVSIAFPRKMALLESGDLAYVWNVCEFADSNEGREQGNCLHVWKLRDEKWHIVLGVFARIPNETQPTLKFKEKGKDTQ